MTVVSTKPAERFTPAHYGDEEGAPVYLVAPLGWKERARFRTRLSEEGVRYPTDAELARAVRSAVVEYDPDNAAELVAAVEAFIDLDGQPLEAEAAHADPDAPDAAPADGSEPEDPAAEQARAEAAAEVAAEIARRIAVVTTFNEVLDATRGHSRVGKLIGLRVAFNELMPPICAAAALRGWEGLKTPFRRANGVVPDDLIEAMPERDRVAVGLYAFGLQVVTGAQRGN